MGEKEGKETRAKHPGRKFISQHARNDKAEGNYKGKKEKKEAEKKAPSKVHRYLLPLPNVKRIYLFFFPPPLPKKVLLLKTSFLFLIKWNRYYSFLRLCFSGLNGAGEKNGVEISPARENVPNSNVLYLGFHFLSSPMVSRHYSGIGWNGGAICFHIEWYLREIQINGPNWMWC